MSMECTTSANSTVTCLYSADRVAYVSGEPHSLQNLAVVLSWVPHDPHDNAAASSASRTVIHASIVSPLVRHVCHIAPGMQPARLHQTDEPPSAAFTICTPY